MVGGTKVEKDVAVLTARPPALLVATPGRLNDLLYEQVALRCTPLALLHTPYRYHLHCTSLALLYTPF